MKRKPRTLYRVWQFWQTLTRKLSPNEWREVRQILTPDELPLFKGMKRADQTHSFRVMKALQADGHTNTSLLTAALLHDAGKGLHPLWFWERPIPVLAKRFFNKNTASLETSTPRGWRRSLIVAALHPAWGAELATAAGASPLTVWLICHHQSENFTPIDHPDAERFLIYLKEADNQN